MATTVILTNYGNDRILEAIADETTVTVSAIIYGDGNGSEYEPLPTQTELRNQLGSISILEKDFDEIEGFIYFKGTIEPSSVNFTIREFGLLDDQNKLLAIATIPSTSKPSTDEGIEVSLPVSIGFKTSAGSVLVVEHDAGDIAAKDWVLDNFQRLSEKSQNNGYAALNENGIVPTNQSWVHYEDRGDITYDDAPAKSVLLLNESNVPMIPLVPETTLYSTTGNNTDGAMTQAATTTELNKKVSLAGTQTITGNKTFSGTNTFSGSTTFSGTATAVTQSTTDNSTKLATTAYVINVLKLMYPIGSIYISTASACPMASLFGTWELVAANKALWTGDGSNANTTIAAGLPNVTGGDVLLLRNEDETRGVDGEGALFTSLYKRNTWDYKFGFDGDNEYTGYYLNFDASLSSSVYGNSDTVQPPAYVVNVWRRTA